MSSRFFETIPLTPSRAPISSRSPKRLRFRFVEKNAPLRRNVSTEEVGNVAAFFLSDLSSGITGEVTYVDAGFSTTTAGLADEG